MLEEARECKVTYTRKITAVCKRCTKHLTVQGGAHMMMPTHECMASGWFGLDAILMVAVLEDVQRCSIGAGAGKPSFSISSSTSAMKPMSAFEGSDRVPAGNATCTRCGGRVAATCHRPCTLVHSRAPGQTHATDQVQVAYTYASLDLFAPWDSVSEVARRGRENVREQDP